MTPERADADLARKLRHLARIEFVRRQTIEECALTDERVMCPALGGEQEAQARAMAVANAIRGLTRKSTFTKGKTHG